MKFFGRRSALVDTVLAIIVVIAVAGFASPVLMTMKQHSANGNEMTQLRQLAISQGIYTAETDGIPMSTSTLVSAGLVSADVCASPLDTSADGISNDLDEELGNQSQKYRDLVLPYRNSYLGLREFGFAPKMIDDSLKGAPGAGWLVSITTTLRRDPKKWSTWYTGGYRRVMLDGSVQARSHEPVPLATMSGKTTAEHPFFLFRDGSLEWKKRFLSGSH